MSNLRREPFFASRPAIAGREHRRPQAAVLQGRRWKASAVAFARWEGRGTRRFSFDESEASSQRPPPPSFALRATGGPPPPLRGGGCAGSFSRRESVRVCRAMMSNSQLLAPSLRGAKRRSNPDFAVGLDCFVELVIGPATSGRTRWLAMTKEEKGRRDAGRRSVYCPARKRRTGRATESAACAALRLRARSPAGVPPRYLRQRPNAAAQLQLTRFPRRN
jgi:hypothetical protein